MTDQQASRRHFQCIWIHLPDNLQFFNEKNNEKCNEINKTQ